MTTVDHVLKGNGVARCELERAYIADLGYGWCWWMQEPTRKIENIGEQIAVGWWTAVGGSGHEGWGSKPKWVGWMGDNIGPVR